MSLERPRNLSRISINTKYRSNPTHLTLLVEKI